MPADFSHLNKLAVPSDKTVEFPLYQLDTDTSLILAPATEANKAYFNALIRKSSKNAARMRANKIDPQFLAENREQDRILFSAYVIKGWKGVVDSAGEVVPFSEENALGFLQALPNHIFDEVRNFAADPQNFIDIDTEGTAKN